MRKCGFCSNHRKSRGRVWTWTCCSNYLFSKHHVKTELRHFCHQHFQYATIYNNCFLWSPLSKVTESLGQSKNSVFPLLHQQQHISHFTLKGSNLKHKIVKGTQSCRWALSPFPDSWVAQWDDQQLGPLKNYLDLSLECRDNLWAKSSPSFHLGLQGRRWHIAICL